MANMQTRGGWTESPSTGLEAVLEYQWGHVDFGRDVGAGDFWACTLGFNYYFNSNVRFMFNWVATDYDDNMARPSHDDAEFRSGGMDHNLLMRLQLTF